VVQDKKDEDSTFSVMPFDDIKSKVINTGASIVSILFLNFHIFVNKKNFKSKLNFENFDFNLWFFKYLFCKSTLTFVSDYYLFSSLCTIKKSVFLNRSIKLWFSDHFNSNHSGRQIRLLPPSETLDDGESPCSCPK